MATLTAYANYGCLAAEKRIVFTQSAPQGTAVVSEKIEFEIPEGWKLGESDMGQPLITSPWGQNYTPNELLCGKKKPYFSGIDKNRHSFNIKLKWNKLP